MRQNWRVDGEELRRRRKDEQQLTQVEMAAALDVYQASFSAWEDGRRGIRNLRILERTLDGLAREWEDGRREKT